MSQDELAATEARRISREAEPKERLTLPALWESAPGGPPKDPVTKQVHLEIEPSPAGKGDGILRIFEGQAFEETILLTPAVYRLVAGGRDPAAANTDLSGRFVLKAGGNGLDRVSVERETLASIMRTVCPVEMARAFRLVATEPRGPAKSAALANQLVTLFTQRWEIDIIHAAVDAAVARVPSRILHLIAGKDLVSLTVRKEELTVGESGVFRSPLATAIVRPPEPQRPSSLIVAGDAEVYRDRDAPFLQNTFGTGPVRRLVLDVAKLRDAVTALTAEAREASLNLLGLLVQRAAELNLEQARRPPVPVHPIAPARRLHKILAPAPAPEAEIAAIDADIETGPSDVEDLAPTMELAAGIDDIEPEEREIAAGASESENDNAASMTEHEAEAEEVDLEGTGEGNATAAIDAEIETGLSDVEDLAPAMELAAGVEDIEPEESEIEAGASESENDNAASMIELEAETEEIDLEDTGDKSEIAAIDTDIETGLSDVEDLAPAMELAAGVEDIEPEESEIEAGASESENDNAASMIEFEAEEFDLEGTGEKNQIEVVEEELETAEG